MTEKELTDKLLDAPEEPKSRAKETSMLKIFLLVNVSLFCWTIVNMQSKEILNVDPPSGSISICEICFLRAVIHFFASFVLLKLTEKNIEKVP